MHTSVIVRLNNSGFQSNKCPHIKMKESIAKEKDAVPETDNNSLCPTSVMPAVGGESAFRTCLETPPESRFSLGDGESYSNQFASFWFEDGVLSTFGEELSNFMNTEPEAETLLFTGDLSLASTGQEYPVDKNNHPQVSETSMPLDLVSKSATVFPEPVQSSVAFPYQSPDPLAASDPKPSSVASSTTNGGTKETSPTLSSSSNKVLNVKAGDRCANQVYLCLLCFGY